MLIGLLASATVSLPPLPGLPGAVALPALPPIERTPQVVFVDRNGARIGVRGGRYGPAVDIRGLPAHVPAAFVAIEDRRFYSHPGFDAAGIARAAAANLAEGGVAQGGSTITQQVARLLFLNQDKTLERKAREVALAVQLERAFTKPQILGLYLSRINFGKGAWGLEAAAWRYFNKPASRLTVREAAMLASIPKSPTGYNPVDQPARNAERTKLVLDAMVETGALSAKARTAALKESPRVWTRAPEASAQYFVDWMDAQARRRAGPVRQDLVVETTLDLPLERSAEEALRSGVARGAAQGVQQGAVVVLDGSGAVRALVGGTDHLTAPYNRATDARRQPGSAFKPFVWLTALEAGRTPETPVVDEPVDIGGWSPANYEPGFQGPMSLETALARSINTVAVRLADEVGRDTVAATARRLGVSTPIPTTPAMALGTGVVTPMDLAESYGAFAAGGRQVEAWGVSRIRTAGGRVVWSRPAPAPPKQIVANPALTDLNRMMRQVVASGTGTRAALPGRDVAGKTGTTSDYQDAWFAGYTGGIVAVVWMGRDDNRPMKGVTGGSLPAEVWRSVMSAAVKRLPSGPIPAGPPPPVPVAGDVPPQDGAPPGPAPAQTPSAPVVPAPGPEGPQTAEPQ
ncbi:MAG: PBP1A family penicillin-binding protein [Phenylobacterium sp.]|uniref:transglycosylase domain-containing protein n=2 Tax=Phenylobacterium sp. TaxID=1871053 RepID=UPI0026007BB3|nr:PBP1A family penicillin-binding protein [Phenylobacterium sp.]MCA6225909.1 PBP1A family penicillin-binding protein [Phenylobacterium sp.]MCA6232467.1 PBP1A family penicillin-binding protein [Phenylobacterium sp.]MCA6234250.1 PBP1A family penicillin-binding protein [Phenylobacterium sp.]MCA6252437.1 PBP1A family penicillin-binding protein [Phenylobacterium sp.]MCA6257780.1 PBP1A family penicillin-binding protein [Phenylobacterium sp.]